MPVKRSKRRRTDVELVELCLPAHLLALMAEQIRRQGWELRADILRYLNFAAAAPLAGLDELSISRVAKRVDEAARALLRGAPDDPRQGMIACAMFTLMLVHEQLYPDPRNQAVLASLLLVEEAKEDPALWLTAEGMARQAAGAMLARARLQGYYCLCISGGSVQHF